MPRGSRHRTEPRTDRATEKGEDRGHPYRERPAIAAEAVKEQKHGQPADRPTHGSVEKRPRTLAVDRLDHSNHAGAGQSREGEPNTNIRPSKPRTQAHRERK